MLHLIVLFLKKAGYEDEAASIQEHYTLPEWVERDNPLIKKGLAKIIKDYVKNNAKVQEYLDNRTQDEEEQSEEEKN